MPASSSSSSRQHVSPHSVHEVPVGARGGSSAAAAADNHDAGYARRPSLGRASHTYHAGTGPHHYPQQQREHSLLVVTPPDSAASSSSDYYRAMPWVRTDAHEDRELGWDVPESIRRSSAPILKAGEEANREELRRKMRFYSHQEPVLATHHEHHRHERHHHQHHRGGYDHAALPSPPPMMHRHLSSGGRSAHEEDEHRHQRDVHHHYAAQHHPYVAQHHHHAVDPLPTPGSAAIDDGRHHTDRKQAASSHRPATTPSYSTSSYASRIVQLDSPPPSAALPAATPQSSSAQSATAPTPASSSSATTVPTGSSRAPISRTTKACNACRQRKVRCDAGATTGEMKPNGEPGTCSRCKETGIECVYTTEQRKRGPMPGSTRGSVSAAAASSGAAGNPGLRRKSSNQHLVGGTPSAQQREARGSVSMLRVHSEGSEFRENHDVGGGAVYRRTTGAPYGYRRAMPPYSLNLAPSDHPALRRPSGIDPLSGRSTAGGGPMARQVSISTAFSSVSLSNDEIGRRLHREHEQHPKRSPSQDRLNMFRQSYSLQGVAASRQSPEHPSPSHMRTGGRPSEFARSESPLRDLQLPPIRVLID